jgi:hypothetical protein
VSRGWPSPLWPDWVSTQPCRSCGRRRPVFLVFVDHDDGGRPRGPFELQCWQCRVADGDPFIAGVPDSCIARR